MKKIFLFAAALISFAAVAQPQGPMPKPEDKGDGFQFTVVKQNPVTSVKNQASSGTCWCFSSLSFIESEVIRINKLKEADYPDLSEMFVVSNAYADKAKKYIRVDGHLNYEQGSSFGDLIYVLRDHGIVPDEIMPGLNYGTQLPVTAELEAVLRGIVEAVAKNPNRTLSTAWQRALQAVLDEYLGKCPEKFTVDGKEYTPASYRDALKINPADYVTLTSFTHHPFYTKFAIEVSDNWRWDPAYNLPIDEFMTVLDNALNNGYTAAWGADVSHPGFTRNGLAINVDTTAPVTSGSDQERWVGKEGGKAPEIKVNEKEATQESRQIDFDNKTMTDDHGMQIYGIAKDQNGKKYYMVKNSWGESSKYKGIWYATESFVKGQTLDIMVHKDAIPRDIKSKLGIK